MSQDFRMQTAEIIGMAAAVLTTLCMLPQVIKSWNTKKTRDLSWGYLGVLGAALFLWTAYGLLTNDFPIILANSVSAALVLALIALKLRHG